MFVTRARRRAPGRDAVIDWSHPLARGLIVALLPRQSAGIVPNLADQANFFTPGGASVQLGAGYFGTHVLKSAASFSPTHSAQKAARTLTTASALMLLDASNSNTGLLGMGTGGPFQLCTLPTTSQLRFQQYGSALATSTNGVSASGGHVVGYSAAGANYRLFIDGVYDVSSSSGTDFGGGQSIDCIGTANGASGNGVFAWALVLQWSRFLSDVEHKTLNADPWQIFVQPVRRFVSAPSGAATATFTTTLGALTLSASAGVPAHATAIPTLAAATAAATAIVPATATSAPTLAAVTAAATAAVPATASASDDLGDATASGTATVPAHADLAVATDNATLSATVGQISLGQVNSTLDNATASGSASAPANASSAPTFDALTVSADAVTTALATGDLSMVLASLALSASAVSAIAATAAPTLDALSAAGAATVPAIGQASVDLFALGLDAQIAMPVGASLAAILGDVRLVALNAVPVTIGNVTIVSGVKTMLDLAFALATKATISSAPHTRLALTISAPR